MFFNADVAANCAMQYRCIKREDKQEPGKNQLKREESSNRSIVYCVIFKKREYPASYRGCPKYLHLKAKLNAKKTSKGEDGTQKIKCSQAL